MPCCIKHPVVGRGVVRPAVAITRWVFGTEFAEQLWPCGDCQRRYALKLPVWSGQLCVQAQGLSVGEGGDVVGHQAGGLGFGSGAAQLALAAQLLLHGVGQQQAARSFGVVRRRFEQGVEQLA